MATSYTNPNQLGTLLRCHEVTKLVGLSRSTVYVLMKNGTFPRSIQLAPRAVRWLASEVDAWIESRILISRPLLILASSAAPDVVHTHLAANQQNHISQPASKCHSQVVKAQQGLTRLTEVWSRIAPGWVSSGLAQACDATRLSWQGAR